MFLVSPSLINDFDGYLIGIIHQSNGTDRFTQSGNLPAGLQGVQVNSKTFFKSTDNYLNTGSFVSMEAGVNTQIGTPQTGMFGISVVLSDRLYTAYGKKAYVVPCAIGGSYFANDVNPSWNVSHVGQHYKRFVENFNQAYLQIRATKKLKPMIIIVGGESDADTAAHGVAYQQELVDIITNLRIDTGFLNMPVIISRIRNDYGGASLGLSDVISGQLYAAANMTNVFCYDTNTIRTPLSTDGQHYNPIVSSYSGTQSAINLGEDLADMINANIKPINQYPYWKNGLATSTSDTEASALISAMTVPPDGTRQQLIKDFFINFKAQSGVTSLTQQFGFISILAAHDNQAARLWWNDPTKLMTLGGTAPTFTTDLGYKNSGNGWIDTLFNPSTGANYSLNNGAGFVYVRDNTAEAKCDMGIINATSVVYIQSRSAVNVNNTALNQAGSLGIANTDARGLWHWRRNASNYVEVYHNGCFFGGGTNASVSLINGNIYILCLNDITSAPTQFSTKQIAAAGACNYSVNPLILYNNIQAYMTGVGANV